MDIGSKHGYPSASLSNFAPHPFVLDGVEISSMEGFLQATKFSNPEMQKYICTLVGFAAKSAGKHKNWKRKQVLYWQGRMYRRNEQEYQELLDRAYDALLLNEGFQRALGATGEAMLTHKLGRTNPKETVLTQSEFCGRLMRLRLRL